MGNLSTLKSDLNEKKWRQIAEDIIKYQDFKFKVAIDKMRGSLSDVTKKNYITSGRYYLKNGKTYDGLSATPSLYRFIDIVKSEHLQPLIPSEQDRARITKPRKKDYTKKNAELSISKMDIIKTPTCAKFEYGVRFGDIIYLMKNEEFAKVFAKGVIATGNNARIVSVEMDDIELGKDV